MNIEVFRKGDFTEYKVSVAEPVLLESGETANAYVNSEIVTRQEIEERISKLQETITAAQQEIARLANILGALPVEEKVLVPLEPVLNAATGKLEGGTSKMVQAEQ